VKQTEIRSAELAWLVPGLHVQQKSSMQQAERLALHVLGVSGMQQAERVAMTVITWAASCCASST